MNTILEQCLSLIDLGQLEKEIKTNPTTKFEEKDIEAIKNGELDVIIYVAKLYAIGSEVITPNPKLALEICRLCVLMLAILMDTDFLRIFMKKGLKWRKIIVCHS